jgi:hypothetical protein
MRFCIFIRVRETIRCEREWEKKERIKGMETTSIFLLIHSGMYSNTKRNM